MERARARSVERAPPSGSAESASGPGSQPARAGPPKRPRLLTSTALMFSAKLSGAVFSLVNVLIVSRALGPSGRGSVVFLMTVAILSSQISALSISEAVSNIAGRSPERRAAVAGNAVVLSVVLGTVAAGVVAGLMAAIPGFGPHVQAWLIVLAI